MCILTDQVHHCNVIKTEKEKLRLHYNSLIHKTGKLAKKYKSLKFVPPKNSKSEDIKGGRRVCSEARLSEKEHEHARKLVKRIKDREILQE